MLYLHSGVPARQRGAPIPVQHLGPDLQQKVGAALAPAHLLFFHKPFADHLVDGRFCEPGRDGFSLPVPFAVIGNKGAISSDIGLEGSHRFEQFPVRRTPLFKCPGYRPIRPRSRAPDGFSHATAPRTTAASFEATAAFAAAAFARALWSALMSDMDISLRSTDRQSRRLIHGGGEAAARG